MTKFIAATGASREIGRAAVDALVEQSWLMIGVARSSPRFFPGVFIKTDLADQNLTSTLADELAARGDVLGIVNNVGVARQETIDSVNPGVFGEAMDLNVRPALQLPQDPDSCP
jgi:short-subunit dehydrogenase